MIALLPPGDVLFIVGVIVATVCAMIAVVEWYENRNGLIAFVMISVAILILFSVLTVAARLW